MINNNRAKALVSLHLWLDCPSCDEQLDLLDIEELNDEAQMWKLVQSNEWDNPGYVFDCPNCEKHIVLSKLEY